MISASWNDFHRKSPIFTPLTDVRLNNYPFGINGNIPLTLINMGLNLINCREVAKLLTTRLNTSQSLA